MNYINQGPIKAAISAVGAFVPEDKLTNADLEKMVDTNDEWILEGGKSRFRYYCLES